MNRSIWTKVGIIELGALAILWRSVDAAPLVASERELVHRDQHGTSTRRFRRDADRTSEQRRAS